MWRLKSIELVLWLQMKGERCQSERKSHWNVEMTFKVNEAIKRKEGKIVLKLNRYSSKVIGIDMNIIRGRIRVNLFILIRISNHFLVSLWTDQIFQFECPLEVILGDKFDSHIYDSLSAVTQ